MNSIAASSFQASWPASLDPNRTTWQEQAIEITLLILKIIFCPIYLPYLGLRKLFSYVLLPSAVISHVNLNVLPYVAPLSHMDAPGGLIDYRKNVDHLEHWFKDRGDRTEAIRCTFTTPDDVQLDGLLIKSRQETPASRKVVLYACPNGGIYEYRMGAVIRALRENVPVYWGNGGQDSLEASDDFYAPMNSDVSIFFFNYRGVGISGGAPSIDQLPLDVYSAYEYLIHTHHFDPSDIVFYGDSMGGGAGPIGAALVQEKYPDARLGGVSAGSFASLSAAVTHNLDAGTLGITAGATVRGLDLDLDVVMAWRKLKGPKFALHYQHDHTVRHSISLAKAVGGEGYTFESLYGHVIPSENSILFLNQACGFNNSSEILG